jgi:anti-sigma factor RsiW
MIRHVSDDDLAEYVEGDLRARKAARIGSHLAGCSSCSDRVAELEALPGLLSSIAFPPIPSHLSARIQLAIAGESAARVASEPASESGRRDLPDRNASPARRGRQLPNLRSPLVVRTLAATGAAVIVAGGGYELASHLGSGNGPSSGTAALSPASPTATGQKLQAGPAVVYGKAGHTHSVTTVQSGTTYQADTLLRQVARVVAAQQVNTAGRPAAGQSHMNSLSAPASAQPNATSAAPPKLPGLAGCVDRIAGDRSVLLVDVARYEGKTAAVIVVGSQRSRVAEVYVVGTACSATTSDILTSQSWHR